MFSHKFKALILGILAISFLSYSLILYESPPRQKAPTSALVIKGKRIWQSKNCSACHQFYGLGGHLGPDLTNVMSQYPAGFVDGYLKNGTNIMPDFHLSDQEITALKAFLTNVDQTGSGDPRKFKTTYDGAIH